MGEAGAPRWLLTFREGITEYLDEQGEPVVTARAVSVLTSQTVRDQ